MKFWSWSLHDALIIGFCSALLVALKGLMRMKLGLSGHSMLLMSFIYLTCLAVVPRIGTVTLCGLMTGMLAMLAGVGKGGPLLILKFGVPAFAMDLALLLGAFHLGLKWRCVLLALVASLAWALKAGIGSLLVGMTWQVGLTKFGISLIQGSAFALVAAVLVPPIVNKLAAHDLLGSQND